MFPADCYGPFKLALMTRALDAAWQEAEATTRINATTRIALRKVMALKIMAAVKEGECDLNSLARVALQAISDQQAPAT